MPYDDHTKSKEAIEREEKTKREEELANRCPNPKCLEKIEALLFQKNTLRRNVYRCPLCSAKILRCRGISCKSYVLSGSIWDDELCSECTNSLAKLAWSAAKATPGVALELITSFNKSVEQKTKK